jgi:hypothetical protein
VQLTDCYDNVVPCFPPGYQAFDTIFAKFHEHLAFMVDCVGAAAATLSSNDILTVPSQASGCANMVAWHAGACVHGDQRVTYLPHSMTLLKPFYLIDSHTTH